MALAAAVLLLCRPAGAERLQLADNPYLPQVRSQAELDAFTAIELEIRPSVRLPLISVFLESFPESELRYLVLRHRWRALTDARSGPDAIIEAARDGIAAVDEFLGTRIDSTSPRDAEHAAAELQLWDLHVEYNRSMAGASRRLNDLTGIEQYTRRAVEAETAAWEAYQRVVPAGSVAYQRQQMSHRALLIGLLRDAMVVFRGAGDLAMVVDFGRQALGVEPNELLTLMVLAAAMSEVQPGETAPRPEHLPAALEYASRAVELLDGGPAPLDAPLSEVNRAELSSSLRSTAGWIYYHLGDYDSAEVALLEATSGAPFDAVTHFRLGLVYSDSERWTDALIHLARSEYISAQQGETDSEVRLELERVYQRLYGSLDGLEAFVAGEGSAMGIEDGVGE